MNLTVRSGITPRIPKLYETIREPGLSLSNWGMSFSFRLRSYHSQTREIRLRILTHNLAILWHRCYVLYRAGPSLLSELLRSFGTQTSDAIKYGVPANLVIQLMTMQLWRRLLYLTAFSIFSGWRKQRRLQRLLGQGLCFPGQERFRRQR